MFQVKSLKPQKYNKFKENNIEIPFPQIDLHMKEQKEKPANGKVNQG